MTTKPIKKSVKSKFCFPLELRLRVVDLLCFLFQPRGGLQTALKGHAGTLRQIHSQQIIPMEQAMVRPPSRALCIIHAMLSSRFHAATAQKNRLENKEKHDFFFLFFFWQTFVRCFSLLVVNNNHLGGGEREPSSKFGDKKKKRYHNTTATGPVVLFFLWLSSVLFTHSRAAASSGSEPSASSPALHRWLLQATLRHEKIMTRNSAA